MLAGLLVLAGSLMADPRGRLLDSFDELTERLRTDPGTLDASKAGLKPDAFEDQSAKLNELLARVEQTEELHTLYVPKGNYLIKKAILLRPRVNLIGDGMGKTVFVRDNEDGYLVGQKGKGSFRQALVAHLTFRNDKRTLLMREIEELRNRMMKEREE